MLNDKLARLTGVALAAAIFVLYVYAGSRFF